MSDKQRKETKEKEELLKSSEIEDKSKDDKGNKEGDPSRVKSKNQTVLDSNSGDSVEKEKLADEKTIGLKNSQKELFDEENVKSVDVIDSPFIFKDDIYSLRIIDTLSCLLSQMLGFKSQDNIYLLNDDPALARAFNIASQYVDYVFIGKDAELGNGQGKISLSMNDLASIIVGSLIDYKFEFLIDLLSLIPRCVLSGTKFWRRVFNTLIEDLIRIIKMISNIIKKPGIGMDKRKSINQLPGIWMMFGSEKSGKTYNALLIKEKLQIADGYYYRCGEVMTVNNSHLPTIHAPSLVDEVLNKVMDKKNNDNGNDDVNIIIVDSLSDLLRNPTDQSGLLLTLMSLLLNEPDLLLNKKGAVQTSGISTQFAPFLGALNQVLQLFNTIVICTLNPLSASDSARKEVISIVASKCVAYTVLDNLSLRSNNEPLIWMSRVSQFSEFSLILNPDTHKPDVKLINRDGITIPERLNDNVNEDDINDETNSKEKVNLLQRIKQEGESANNDKLPSSVGKDKTFSLGYLNDIMKGISPHLAMIENSDSKNNVNNKGDK